jgi:hypothetical protein
MEDKEVGEVWAVNRQGSFINQPVIDRLIRKLVEERMRIYTGNNDVRLHEALEDFGIPPETFPHDSLAASITVPR